MKEVIQNTWFLSTVECLDMVLFVLGQRLLNIPLINPMCVILHYSM